MKLYKITKYRYQKYKITKYRYQKYNINDLSFYITLIF